MNDQPDRNDYLDGIFGALRRFSLELEASRAWTARADEAPSPAWRRSFLAAAVASQDRACASLRDLRSRLAALGGEGSWPQPLDRLARSVTKMAADLEAHRAALEATEVTASPPIGDG